MVILLSVCGVAAVLLLCLCVCLCKCFICTDGEFKRLLWDVFWKPRRGSSVVSPKGI